MRAYPTLLILLFLTPFAAAMTYTNADTFSDGQGCAGGLFSCGVDFDGIVALGGQVNVSLVDNGVTTDFFCAYFINNSVAVIETCIYQNGLADTACDADTDILAADHSFFYECPFSNMSLCAWNGENGIPRFATGSPSVSWQIDTSATIRQEIIFASFECGVGVTLETLTEYIATDTKGVLCINALPTPVVWSDERTIFAAPQICDSPSFCDPGAAQNYSMSLDMSNASYCSPGCYDNAMNGDETDIDYGGFVCGNCSAEGKKSDADYVFARTLQQDNQGFLTAQQPFDASLYCAQGEELGGSIFSLFIIILLFCLIVILGFFFVYLIVLSPIVLAVGGVRGKKVYK